LRNEKAKGTLKKKKSNRGESGSSEVETVYANCSTPGENLEISEGTSGLRETVEKKRRRKSTCYKIGSSNLLRLREKKVGKPRFRVCLRRLDGGRSTLEETSFRRRELPFRSRAIRI